MIKELAGRDPARAEALLATLKEPDILARQPAAGSATPWPGRTRTGRAGSPTATSGRAPTPRRCRSPGPYALGMIALALADTDKPRAARFLDEAFAALKPLAAEGRRGSRGLEIQDAAIVAAALVPVAERIDPALVPEFFWRAASFRDAVATPGWTRRPRPMPRWPCCWPDTTATRPWSC